MDKEGKMRATQWALQQHQEGKSKLSPYQVRNLKKVTASTRGKMTKTTDKTKKYTKVSAQDMHELKKLNKRARDIMNKYRA